MVWLRGNSAAFGLPPTIDFPLPAPFREVRFFRWDGGGSLKGFRLRPSSLFPKFVEVTQKRRELAFPKVVLLVSHFPGAVLGAGSHKSQNTVLAQRARASRNGIYTGIERL